MSNAPAPFDAAILHAKHNQPEPPRSHLPLFLGFWLGAGKVAGDVLNKIAQKHHASPKQVALAWLLRRSQVVLPIPDTSSIQHLEENVAAGSLQLTREKYELLAEVPEWSHRGRFQGRALKSRHRRCLRAFATVGGCAIFAFPLSRPISVAPLATTFHHSVGP
jgi:aryl-alcohol dehydrogenase-like predicted oxidoreductase